MASYTPPALAGSSETAYSYDPDHQLSTLTRPDGQTVNLAYDAAGRLSTVTTPASFGSGGAGVAEVSAEQIAAQRYRELLDYLSASIRCWRASCSCIMSFHYILVGRQTVVRC